MLAEEQQGRHKAQQGQSHAKKANEANESLHQAPWNFPQKLLVANSQATQRTADSDCASFLPTSGLLYSGISGFKAENPLKLNKSGSFTQLRSAISRPSWQRLLNGAVANGQLNFQRLSGSQAPLPMVAGKHPEAHDGSSRCLTIKKS